MRRLVLAVVLAAVPGVLAWTGPFQLTGSPGADINPSACKEWVQGQHTCLVWQTDRDSTWDIWSRLCALENGNGWLPEAPVGQTAFDEVHPAVCALQEPNLGWFACAWERRDNPDFTTIWVAFGDDSCWRWYDSIASTANGPFDSARVSLVDIPGSSMDTVWAVWQDVGTSGYRIDAKCCRGLMEWSERMTIHADSVPKRSVRVGRRMDWRQGSFWPLVVWEQDGAVLFSEFRSGAWTPADTVAPSPARDRDPDVASALVGGLFECGPWIAWTSERDGDTAVYRTPRDTFDRAIRWSDTVNAGRNWSPCGTVMYMTTDWEPLLGLCVSDQNGNPDIYSLIANDWYTDWAVDTHPADDLNPTLTTLGDAYATTLCWACWQSDRGGDWNLYGSFMYNTGVEEERTRLKDEGGGLNRTVYRAAELARVDCRVLDIQGRDVTDRRGRLAPGVYFLKDEGGRLKDEPVSRRSVRKVIIQR